MQPNITRGRELVEAALCWLDEGISVVPAQPQSKAVRLPWRQYEVDFPSRRQIQEWFQNGVMNLAVICGTGGLLVLDFDDLNKYKLWQLKAGALAGTYTESTGRGMHVFYQVGAPRNARFVECEALGLGHLSLVAPSVHPSGAAYSPLDMLAPIMRAEASEIFSLLSELPKPESHQERQPLSKGGAASALSGDVIGKIKAGFPLLSYAETLTTLKTSGGGGRWLLGLCPLHEDQDPSFYVDAKRGLWRCYSPNCRGHRGGDVINLYALKNNIETNEAIKRLAREVLCSHPA